MKRIGSGKFRCCANSVKSIRPWDWTNDYTENVNLSRSMYLSFSLVEIRISVSS